MKLAIPIGELSINKVKFCSICGIKYSHKYSIIVYDGDIGAKYAQEKLIKKTEKPYTCKICKSIKKEMEKEQK